MKLSEMTDKQRESAKEASRKSYAKNKAKHAEMRRARKNANPALYKLKDRECRDKHKEKRKANSKKYYQENKEYFAKKNKANSGNGYYRKYNLARYDLTLEKFDELFESQNSCCALCKSTEPGSKNGWQVDHCHKTNRVRGILCHHCNVMLGHAKDDPSILLAAIEYLKTSTQLTI